MLNANQPEKIGRYRVIEKVGQGAMGVLFRGIDPVLDREVAIKVMLLDFSDDQEQMRARFFREARAIAKLQHRNIVTVFEFAEENNTPYIVMEFLRGTSLASRMASPRPLSLDERLGMVVQLCAALHYAHEQGVVHRDVKPANLFLLDDGSVKLLDFGIAKVSTSTLTRTSEVLGSVAYMSPEQVAGSNIDGRSDIFSAGVLLYELLARRKPFESTVAPATIMKILHEPPPPLEEVVAGLPTPLLTVVSRALEKKPEDRFQVAGELADALEAVRRTLGPAKHSGPLEETRLTTDAEVREYKGLVAASTQLDAGPALASATVQAKTVSEAPARNRPWIIPAGVAALVAVAVIIAAVVMRKGNAEPAIESAPAVTPPAASAGVASRPTTATPDAPVAGTPSAAATSPAKTGAALAALERVTVRVESDPVGAAITVDGRNTNQITPASVSLTGGVSHRLRLAKPGFAARDATITADDIGRGTVSFALGPVTSASANPVSAGPGGGNASGSAPAGAGTVAISIRSTYPVEVFAGSRPLSAAAEAHQLTVDAGTTVQIRAPQYMLDAALKAEGKTLDYQAPPIGYLTVLTKYETCRVKIGERDLGYPPITKLPIASGQHRVDISCANGPNPPGQLVTIAPNIIFTARIY